MFASSLNNLRDFIALTSGGLTKEVPEGEYNALVECMGYLGAVRQRIPETDNMFEPLKQTIDLLKTYQQEMSEDVHQLLEVGAVTEYLSVFQDGLGNLVKPDT